MSADSWEIFLQYILPPPFFAREVGDLPKLRVVMSSKTYRS